ncbi:MAG: heavy-metal-associated domain-containing protein [Phycisphaeraceae bacterium]|nr:heavy-metal-associated domain-containing protein [Phycisphaeraceae bacterium]
MRTLTLTATLILLLTALAGCKHEETSPPPPEVEAEVTAASIGLLTEPLEAGEGETLMTFDIEGMVCMGCVESIENAVCALPQVKKASVNLEQKKAWVITDAADQAQPQTIIDAIVKLQYKAKLASPEP